MIAAIYRRLIVHHIRAICPPGRDATRARSQTGPSLQYDECAVPNPAPIDDARGDQKLATTVAEQLAAPVLPATHT